MYKNIVNIISIEYIQTKIVKSKNAMLRIQSQLIFLCQAISSLTNL